MQPLSLTVRRAYLILFIVLFFAVLPLVILYADGWRWNREQGFYKTGGLFISVPYQDADVTIDGEHIGRSGYLDRSFYVDNLETGSYRVFVEREGYLPWNRTLVVEPQIVTDGDALLIPKRIESERLLVSGTATTGIAVISRSEYDSFLESFGTTTPPRPLQTLIRITPQDQLGDIGLIVNDGDVFVRWLSESAFPPSRFCVRPSSCVSEFPLARGESPTKTARFFRGGVVYVTSDGVYFSEMDVRPSPVSVKIFDAEDADIRIIDDRLIVKIGLALYEVLL